MPNASNGAINSLVVNDSGVALLFINNQWKDSLISNNAYQANRNEIILMKLNNSSFQPEWCTYLGGDGEDNFGFYNNYFKASRNAYFVSGLTTSHSTDLIRTNKMYKKENANPDSTDLFVMKFNTFGQLNWGTFYGGTNTEADPSLVIGNDSIFYLAGRTYSISGISSNGSFEDTMSFAPGQKEQMVPGSIYISRGNGFVVKFIDTTHKNVPVGPDTTINDPQHSPLSIYPIPNNGNFTIKGNILAEKDFFIAIFDALGKRITQRRLLRIAQQNFIYSKLLASGIYVVKIHSVDNQINQAFKMIVKQK